MVSFNTLILITLLKKCLSYCKINALIYAALHSAVGSESDCESDSHGIKYKKVLIINEYMVDSRKFEVLGTRYIISKYRKFY